MTKTVYIEWSRSLDDKNLPGGFLSVQRDGTIVVTVDDDYYNGLITRQDAIRFFDALKEVLEHIGAS